MVLRNKFDFIIDNNFYFIVDPVYFPCSTEVLIPRRQCSESSRKDSTTEGKHKDALSHLLQKEHLFTKQHHLVIINIYYFALGKII